MAIKDGCRYANTGDRPVASVAAVERDDVVGIIHAIDIVDRAAVNAFHAPAVRQPVRVAIGVPRGHGSIHFDVIERPAVGAPAGVEFLEAVQDAGKRQTVLGVNYRRFLAISGSFCRTLPRSAQASLAGSFVKSGSVNWWPLVVRAKASHDTGMDTGAPARARVE